MGVGTYLMDVYAMGVWIVAVEFAFLASATIAITDRPAPYLNAGDPLVSQPEPQPKQWTHKDAPQHPITDPFA